MWVQARGSSREEKERLCARHTVMRSTTTEWRGILLSSPLYCAGSSVNEATVLSHISAERSDKLDGTESVRGDHVDWMESCLTLRRLFLEGRGLGGAVCTGGGVCLRDGMCATITKRGPARK